MERIFLQILLMFQNIERGLYLLGITADPSAPMVEGP